MKTFFAVSGLMMGMACGGSSDSKQSSVDTGTPADSQEPSGDTSGGGDSSDTSPPEAAAAKAVAEMTEAAEAFLGSLDAEMQAAVQFELDDRARKTWSNLPLAMYKREGVLTGDLTPEQLELAYDLLRSSLSSQGYTQAVNIVEVDEWLLVNQGNELMGEDLYSISIFGTPSETETWSWQFDGHHLCFTFTVKKDQVAMSPSLWGVNPVEIPSGNLEGLRAMGDEVDTAFALLNSLSSDQRSVAVINDKVSPGLFAGPGEDNYTIPEDELGLSARDMNTQQKNLLLKVVETFVLDMEDTHGALRMAEIEAGIEDLHFAWMGPSAAGSEIYYRIYGPTVLIELDHPNSNNHIHSVYRNPQNDYGASLLSEHYARYPHNRLP